MARILIADSIAQEGITLLQREHDVVVRTGLSEDELVEAVRDVDAIVVRSQTQITARVIEAAPRLAVVGRAGVGVDNIDVPAATQRGVIVANAPLANTLSAAEHTFALMLALARHLPQADASLRAGRWDRNTYMGVELAGRTLGVVGLGRIGAEVASRARAFQMRVIAYDPFVSPERASALGVETMSLEELLPQADFVTLHTALTEGTRNLLNAERLALMKRGARVVNAARGALIDEQALYDAVESGHIGGAAIDVFSKEPAVGNVLTTHPRIVVTPHLAASTAEAQDRAAITVAEEVAAVLSGRGARFAVNAPLVDPETMAVIGPYLDAAELAAAVAGQLADGQLERMRIEYVGEIGNYDVTPIRASAILGLLQRVNTEKVSIVNADATAAQRGLRIEEDRAVARPPFSNLVVVHVFTSSGETTVAATQREHGVAVVRIGEFEIDIPPQRSRHVVMVENEDRPGTIGRVGTVLGGWDVNVNYMSVAPGAGDHALMVLGTSRALTTEELTALTQIENVFAARQLDLG